MRKHVMKSFLVTMAAAIMTIAMSGAAFAVSNNTQAYYVTGAPVASEAESITVRVILESKIDYNGTGAMKTYQVEVDPTKDHEAGFSVADAMLTLRDTNSSTLSLKDVNGKRRSQTVDKVSFSLRVQRSTCSDWVSVRSD